VNNDSILPSSPEALLATFGERIAEAYHFLLGIQPTKEFPLWVLKMGKSVREQMLSAAISKAIDAKDEAFLCGVFVGAMAAMRHHANTVTSADRAFSERMGLAAAKIAAPDEPPPKMPANGIVELLETQFPLDAIFKDFHAEPREVRGRFLEGMIEGSDLELLMQNGSLRPGLAHNTQILMLLFWPQLEAMKTRRKAYDAIQSLLKDTPAAQRSEEAFIRLAKDYGYKSRKYVKGG
jgi:hypothetical protein